MVIREWNSGDDHAANVSVSARKGDKLKTFVRNNNHQDVPLLICYNLGADLHLCTDAEKRQRVHAMLKMLRVVSNRVMDDIGSLVGVYPPPISNESGDEVAR